MTSWEQSCAPPPQGYGRPGSRGGMPPWAKVVIIVLVVMLGGCTALAGFGYYALKRSGLIADIPKAKVHTGTPLQWQTIAQWKGSGMFNTMTDMDRMFAGNFDDDPDE